MERVSKLFAVFREEAERIGMIAVGSFENTALVVEEGKAGHRDFPRAEGTAGQNDGSAVGVEDEKGKAVNACVVIK